jgi:hypothetical protein
MIKKLKNRGFYSPLPPSERGKFLLLFCSFLLLFASCKTKEVPGRRRTPRNCNTCTKWSYVPQEAIDYELLHHDEA